MEEQQTTPIRRLGLPLVILLLSVLIFWAWQLVVLISEVRELQSQSAELQKQIGSLTRQRDQLSVEETALKKQIGALETESTDYDTRVKEARQLLDRLGIRESDRQRINDLLDRGGRPLTENDGILPRSVLARLQGAFAERKLTSPDLHLLREIYAADAELAMLDMDSLIQEATYRSGERRTSLLREALRIGEASLSTIREGNTALEAGMRGRMASALSALADRESGKEGERTRLRALELFEFALENAGAARRNDWYLLALKEKKKLAGGIVSKDVADYACDEHRVGSSQVRMNNCASFLSAYADTARGTAPRAAADAACRAAELFRPINEAPIEGQIKYLERVKEKCTLLRRAADR
jgi:cell division protein FtsB